MNQEQTNRVTMFKTTNGVLEENQSIWSGMAAMVGAVQDFKDVIAAIDHSAQTQETPTIGAAMDKHSARDSLEDVLFLICEALGVVGHTAKDNDLVALVNLAPSSIHKMGDEELANRATTILDRATAKKADLAALNVTQANIDELNQALQDYKTSKEKPREVVAVRSAETQSLSSLIRQANGILRNRIDPMVNLFRRSNPKFVAAHRSARVVVDRPATHASSKTPPPSPPTPQA
jgi:transketolase N-terminal domain/subunit